jgi:ribosomal protein S18 acetylase RimI-like enzyme
VLETIREATPADGAAIAAVNVVSWQVGYRGLLPEEMLAGLSVAELEQRWTAGLRAGGARVSTLVACRGADVGADLAEPGTDLGELRTIYVHPDHWRHGIGSRLHTAALHKLATSGFPLAVLFALVGNDRAISFYRRAGWVMDGGRKTGVGPAGVRLDEVRLHRTLP